LVLLPTLAFVGVVTFERALQSGVEDAGYARRIALARGFYFDHAPETTPYLLSVPEAHRLEVQGLGGGRWQGSRSVSGMVGVITAVPVGATVGLAAAVIFDHELAVALLAGGVTALISLYLLMRFHRAVWRAALEAPISYDEEPPRTSGL
jgi:hypothetical protein